MTAVAAPPTTMRSAVMTAPGSVMLQEVALPEPGVGEVRIRLEGSGVCASSLPVVEGRDWFNYPLEPGAPGHEGWGLVDAVGPGVAGLHTGDRVTALSWRTFAQYDLARAEDVVVLPPQLGTAAVPGEPLACAMLAFQRARIGAGDDVAVIGIGFLGAIITRLAANAGARVIAISRRAFALEVARACGAEVLVPMDDHDRIIGRVQGLTSQRGCDVTVEAVGLQWPLDLAAAVTRESGRLVIAGYHQDGLRQVNMQLWNWRAFDIVNAHERNTGRLASAMRDAVDAVAAGGIDLAPLLTHRYPLEQLDQAFRALRERPDGFVKAVVQP